MNVRGSAAVYSSMSPHLQAQTETGVFYSLLWATSASSDWTSSTLVMPSADISLSKESASSAGISSSSSDTSFDCTGHPTVRPVHGGGEVGEDAGHGEGVHRLHELALQPVGVLGLAGEAGEAGVGWKGE